MEVRRTPLHAEHQALGAKMVEFAGWEMPVQYEGVVHESLAVRRKVGMFDVSHMARLHFRGPAAFDYLEHMTANDVSKLVDGASQYSLLCYPDGGCVDDIILYRIGPEWFRMVVNAANHAKDVAWLTEHLRDGVTLEDETERTAMIAVQGPEAVPTINRMAGEDLSDMTKFTAREFRIAGRPVFGARTGYTGEDGFELILAAEDGPAVWQALLEAGVTPCGLAARDVLRLEAGLPLYGHELTKDINPIEAGLGWVVSKTKSFIGSEPINAMRSAGPPRKAVGIRMESKMVPREGYPVLKDGAEVGSMTSGVYSPLLEVGIGFALVKSEAATLNEPCEVVVREKPHPATMVGKRFLPKT